MAFNIFTKKKVSKCKHSLTILKFSPEPDLGNLAKLTIAIKVAWRFPRPATVAPKHACITIIITIAD